VPTCNLSPLTVVHVEVLWLGTEHCADVLQSVCRDPSGWEVTVHVLGVATGIKETYVRTYTHAEPVD